MLQFRGLPSASLTPADASISGAVWGGGPATVRAGFRARGAANPLVTLSQLVSAQHTTAHGFYPLHKHKQHFRQRRGIPVPVPRRSLAQTSTKCNKSGAGCQCIAHRTQRPAKCFLCQMITQITWWNTWWNRTSPGIDHSYGRLTTSGKRLDSSDANHPRNISEKGEGGGGGKVGVGGHVPFNCSSPPPMFHWRCL